MNVGLSTSKVIEVWSTNSSVVWNNIFSSDLSSNQTLETKGILLCYLSFIILPFEQTMFHK